MSSESINSGTQTPATLLESPAYNGTQTPYTFPTQKLKRRQSEPGKTPLVLVACGSFSRRASRRHLPMHLLMV